MTTITCSSDEDVCDLIEKFGKQSVKAMYAGGLIDYIIPDEYLIECGFKKKILSAARNNINHGKMVLHLNKSTGKVKQTFYGFTILSTIDNIEAEQSPEKKAILMRMYDIFYEAFVVRYKKKFEGIDLEIDPITCDTMQDPVYIRDDWENNSKIVYSKDTLLRCYARKRELTSFHTDEDGETIYHYKEIPLRHYVSPYTNKQFYLCDIISVRLSLL
jgi:hypothetical protein